MGIDRVTRDVRPVIEEREHDAGAAPKARTKRTQQMVSTERPARPPEAGSGALRAPLDKLHSAALQASRVVAQVCSAVKLSRPHPASAVKAAAGAAFKLALEWNAAHQSETRLKAPEL